MSDSDESGVTYTDISSLFEELSDIRSPRADDHEHLMLPKMLEDPYVEVALQAPPSPDYIPGPEELEQDPPLPYYVPGPEHADDEIVAEDQPYAEDASPIAQSPEYDPEEHLVDYPADGGDDGDDAEESLKDDEEDEDDEMDIEANDEEEEEEHPAPADSIPFLPLPLILAPPSPVLSLAPPPSPIRSLGYRAAMIRLRYEAASTSSPPLQLPSTSRREDRPEIPFLPLPLILAPPSPVLSLAPPPSPIRSLGYRAAMIRLRYEAASTSSPPLQLPSTSRREDRPEVTLPPRKRLAIALGPRYKVGESSSSAATRPAGGFREDYGFVATVDREILRDPQREIGYGITDSWDEIGDSAGSTSQMSEIRELQAADRRRQTLISELLRIDHKRSTEISELRTALHGQVTALQGQVTALQSELPEEASGSA
nr:hypothetical protein [Tanacetum cinerariifolium]